MSAQRICFAIAVGCMAASLMVGIFAVWGVVQGALVWRSLATYALIGGGAAAYSGIERFFYPSETKGPTQ